jgi:formylmethanofuran dehydrogenase subunit A
MSAPSFCIRGGAVYDPANGVDGDIRDIWIAGGRIVAPPIDPHVSAARTLDATGLVVMPGGIDMHCHIAGPKVNMARKMRPEDHRGAPPLVREGEWPSGTGGSMPSTFATAYQYAGLGYTTAFDAAIPPIAARHVHEEFEDTPCLDKGFFVLAGNHHYVLDALAERDSAKLRDFLAWLLGATRAFAPKLVNPGGVEMWKQHVDAANHGLDDLIGGFGVSGRQIVAGIAQAAEELRLPHPVHIHANRLGMPGNWRTTLETMRALEGRRGHLTHIQFHSYAGGGGDESTFGSAVRPLVEYFNQNDNITVDVGQVLFGATTSMTGDGPLGYYLHQIYGTKWYSGDTELESGCGIVPIEYKQKSVVHAWQWAVGLEWYLTAADPWRIAMSTDHPNGGSFTAYPEIIRLLMDSAYRREIVSRLPAAVRERSLLADLDREFSLSEICTLTRAAPARILGLKHKGHLGPGADADLALYAPQGDYAAMFQLPRYVIKGGEIIVDDATVLAPRPGKTLHVAPDFDRDRESQISDWFNRHYTVRFNNYSVGEQYLGDNEQVACDRADTELP